MRMRVSPIDVRVRMGDAIGPFQLANGFEAVIGYECQERSVTSVVLFNIGPVTPNRINGLFDSVRKPNPIPTMLIYIAALRSPDLRHTTKREGDTSVTVVTSNFYCSSDRQRLFYYLSARWPRKKQVQGNEASVA